MSLKIFVPFPVRGDLVPFVPPDAAAAFPAVRSKESGCAMCARTITNLNWHRKCERDKNGAQRNRA